MDFDFLTCLSPRIIDVVDREAEYWKAVNYELYRDPTLLHVLALVCEGTGLLEIDGFSATLRPGCVFHLAPGSQMRITTATEHTLRYYSVHFDYGMLRWEGTTGVWKNGSIGALPFPRVMIPADWAGLCQLYRQLLEIWNQKQIGYEWYVRVGFMNILCQVAQLQHALDRQEFVSVGVVQQAIEYIQAHLNEPLDRDTLARHVVLSPAYFSTLFKRYTGYSPIQYITRLRIDRAKHLLRTTMLPISVIAHEVGFADSFYFSRVFSRETGMSPRNYRRA